MPLGYEAARSRDSEDKFDSMLSSKFCDDVIALFRASSGSESIRRYMPLGGRPLMPVGYTCVYIHVHV